VNDSTVRILTILEAHSVTGPAKAVFEFAREAKASAVSSRIDLSILTFLRGPQENGFIRAVRERGIPLDIVTEKGRFDFGVIPQLRAAVNRRRPNIIWTNGVKSHFLVRLSGLHHQVKWVAFHHGYTKTDWKDRLYSCLDYWSHPAAARLVTVCGKFAQDISGRGIPADRIYVEHMPIRRSEPAGSGPAAALRRDLGIEDTAPVILSVGRLSKEKGHSELLKAFQIVKKSNPAARLVVVGSGPELHRLQALGSELGLDGSIHFLGHQNDVRPAYAIADVFVLSSHSEGSPNVLLEAMDAGVPIVATAVGGVPEIVSDGVTAILVSKHDVAGIAAGVIRLLGDADLRLRLIHGSREVLDRHSPEQYYRRLAAMFQEVAG
jgi:glycosyltransferase involved in cell wall biosynthesis